MGEQSKGFGEQLFQRLQGQGMSRTQVYKVLALQRLCEEVTQLGAEGLLPEASLLEISKIGSAARQKQVAEVAVEHELPAAWVKDLVHLVRAAEKSKNDRLANQYWDFFFEIKDDLTHEGATKELQERVRHFTAEPSVEGLGGAAERRIVDFRKYQLAAGRGLDVGTSNIVGSARQDDGGSLFNIQRNAFLDVRSDVFTQKMLMKLGVDHFVHEGKAFVIGDPAFELANIFEKNTRRPMKDGMISPTEPDALLVERLVIGQVLGKPLTEGEICAFSIPADPIDAERNVVYHSGAIETILRGLGYTPKPVLEGHAVVFGELGEEDYTGIGISCGAGMFNICIAYKSLPALVFSTSRGGDWIDNNVAHALGLPGSQVCAIKESGVDLNRPRDRVEEAICIYYRNLIHYSLETIRQRFETAQNMPVFTKPISVVCSGGTSMVKGFIDVFRGEFKTIDFPIDVKEIRLARDPLRTVAFGCLEGALEETRARGGAPSPMSTVERASVSKTIGAPIRPTPAPPAPASKSADPGSDTDVFETATFDAGEEGTEPEVAPEDAMDEDQPPEEAASDSEENSGPSDLPLIS
ncbi:MAG TPA: hypothetical protein VGK61_02435 [Planctomycetota bacterium]|jgi:hypothetical protein